MNDDQLLDRLRSDMARAAAGRHLDPGAVRVAIDRTSERRAGTPAHQRWAVAATAAAVIALTVVLALLLPATDRNKAAPGTGACADVRTGRLPTWAREGFSPGADRVPHVLGEHGRVVAILFTRHLYSPALPNPHNKVLWVVRGGWFGPFVIRGHLTGTGTTVRRLLPAGPGPSYLNLPAPGCWQLSLRWGDERDSLALRYLTLTMPH